MRIYTEKQKTNHQTTNARTTVAGLARFGHSSEVDPRIQIPHSLGNKAKPRFDHAEPARIEVVPSTPISSPFGHHISRIPVHATASGKIQAKLEVTTPGDMYEQEADRVSEQMMRLPEPHSQHDSSHRGGRPACQNTQSIQNPEGIHARQIRTSDSRQVAVPSSVHDVINAPGRPLDQATRGFMEPRFGHDFSGVRVHTDARAAESARAMKAMAYTVGRSIAFGAGRYSPETAAGRSLLGHELTHVLQQSGGDSPRLQRQETRMEEPVATGTSTESNPVPAAAPLPAPGETAAEPLAADAAKLSGKTWWDANEKIAPYTKSSDIADLESDFQGKVKEFKKALDDAGTSISIDTTKRPKERAHVLHYAWQVSKGQVKANAVPAMTGVDIVWDHGDETKSKAGAQEIVTAASVKSKPSLTSNHIDGKAIDWTITWTSDPLKIDKKDGTKLEIKTTPRNGGDPGNAELHEVGKGYGVHKGLNFNPKDPPHWSFDGT